MPAAVVASGGCVAFVVVAFGVEGMMDGVGEVASAGD